MATTNFEEILRKHRGEFAAIVPFKEEDKIIAMDFTENNKELTDDILADEDKFVRFMYAKLRSEEVKYAIGGYDEHRHIYRRSPLFDGDGSEARRLHLGIDIWGKPHTKVMAPMNGIVHSLGNNNAFGDYGATIILSHQIEGITFHTLYGHLSLSSLGNLQPGENIMKGDVFAEFGMPDENGHWPPHLHFQIILDMEGMKGDYPGVCTYSERERYLENCPDGELILGMMQYVTEMGV